MDESLKLPEAPGPVIWAFAVAPPAMFIANIGRPGPGWDYWLFLGVMCAAAWCCVVAWLLRRSAAIRSIKVGG